MPVHHPDRVLGVLAVVTSISFYLLAAACAAVLVAGPAARLLADGPTGRQGARQAPATVNSVWEWGLEVPAELRDAEEPVETPWGPGRVEIERVRATLMLPIATLPWRLVAILWTHVAFLSALMLLALHHLRRIIQRVRAGAPFEAANALRMRRLGVLLLALTLLDDLARYATAVAVRNWLASRTVEVAVVPRFDLRVAFVALVIIALAEVFRRGAELEDEQSLVI